jgi:anti-anti-sigma regulatory factor
MACELLIGQVPGGVIIRVVGRGTMKESVAFRALIEANLERNIIIFDATQCEYLDSTFLGGLIGIKKLCEQLPTTRFVVCASEPTRVKLFSTSSLNKYFDFIETPPESLGGCTPVEIESLDTLTIGRHSMRCHENLAERGGRDAAAFKSVADCLRKELDQAPGVND